MSDVPFSNPLDFLCAVLSPCISDEERYELAGVASSGAVDWPAVAKHANYADLAPALYSALVQKGVTTGVPALFLEYVQELHRFNLERNQALLLQLRDVVGLLNTIGVTPVLLKGAAILATEIYPDPGMRFMADLDLLVPADALWDSVRVLSAAGYDVPRQYQGAALPYNHHFPPLVRPGGVAAVELHSLLMNKMHDLPDLADVWANSRPCQCEALAGLSAALMAPTDELIYCFAHAEFGHFHQHNERIGLRHLLDFVYLARKFQGETDFGRLEALKHHPCYGLPFEVFLCQARRLFRLDLFITRSFSPAAEEQYDRIRSCIGRWKGMLRLLRLLIRDLSSVFSKQRMLTHWQHGNTPLWRLRLEHLGRILMRYWRPIAWRERAAKLRSH